MRHATLAILAILAAAVALSTAPSAHAVGRLVDVEVVDRDTGETVEPVLHRGEWWIAGRPGARYGVWLKSRQAQRTLNVVSIDGVNAISGDTAAWDQTGYVLSAFERTRIDGWRKNMNQVAAFEFTALPDAYAARTGRPANVGVIGVAVFREWRRPPPILRREAAPAAADRAPSASPAQSSPAAPSPSSDGDAASAPASAARADAERNGAALSERRERLGTDHGAIEGSVIRYVAFERAQPTPDEVVTIRYDRAENLVAMGIVPAPRGTDRPMPDAFPNSGRFVADPPPR